MVKILITGVNGFVGQHLANELNTRGVRVVGIGMDPNAHPSVVGLLNDYLSCDLTDANQVKNLPLDDVSAIINLAGLAKVGESFDKPDLYKHVNVAVLSILGKRLLAEGSKIRVIAISTGAVYSPDQPMPLTEGSKLITSGSPYAFSKIAMEEEAVRMRNQGLNCAIVRPFNHIGPGQESGFLIPDLLAKIQTASKSDGIVMVGDLTTKRDYTDVRDVVRAYADLAAAPTLQHAIYNVCSGRSIAGETILEVMLKATGATGEIAVSQDPALMRPDDPKDLFGSNELLHTETGWQPAIPLEQTIRDFVASKK